jgi:hypothetical protein
MDPATAASPAPQVPPDTQEGAEKPPKDLFKDPPKPQGNPGPPTAALPSATPQTDQQPVPPTPQIKPSMYRYTELQKSDPTLWENINQAGILTGVDPVAIANVAYLESRWNVNEPENSKHAVGLMQVTPAAAADADPTGRLDRNNPHDNLILGSMYLNKMFAKYGQGTASAYAAYFAGPGGVDAIARMSPDDQRKNFPHVLDYPQQIAQDKLNGVVRPGAGTVDDHRGASTSPANQQALVQSRVGDWLAALTPEQRAQIKPSGGDATGVTIDGITPEMAQTLGDHGLTQQPGQPNRIGMTAASAGDTKNFQVPGSAPDTLAVSNQPGSRDQTQITDGANATGGPTGSQVASAAPAPGAAPGGASTALPLPQVNVNAKAPHPLTPGSQTDFRTLVSNVSQGGPDAGMNYLQQSNPKGMTSDDLLRTAQNSMLAWTMHLGPAAMEQGQEFVTMFAQHGTFQHLKRGFEMQSVGDAQGAANEYAQAYKYFPNGENTRFRVTGAPGQQNIWGERYDPHTGDRIGEPFQVNPQMVRNMLNITSNPQTYLKTLGEMQKTDAERLHYQSVADHYKDMADHYSNQAAQAAEADKTRRDIAAQQQQLTMRDFDLKLQQNIETARTAAAGHALEQQKLIAPQIKEFITSDETSTDFQKQAISAIMNNLLSRDANTNAKQAYYYGQGIINKNFTLGQAYQEPTGVDSRSGKTTYRWDVPVMSKDGTTKLTYLPRDVLQSAGLWRRDAANPDAAGRAIPVPGGPTVPNRFAAAPPLGRPALPGANYASPSF